MQHFIFYGQTKHHSVGQIKITFERKKITLKTSTLCALLWRTDGQSLNNENCRGPLTPKKRAINYIICQGMLKINILQDHSYISSFMYNCWEYAKIFRILLAHC